MDALGAVAFTDTFRVDTHMDNVAVAFGAVQGRRKVDLSTARSCFRAGPTWYSKGAASLLRAGVDPNGVCLRALCGPLSFRSLLLQQRRIEDRTMETENTTNPRKIVFMSTTASEPQVRRDAAGMARGLPMGTPTGPI